MSLPLVQRFPGVSSLPRVELCALPTPLLSSEPPAGMRSLTVKRDDMTNAVYGGNKVRKLEFLLGEALDRGSKAVLTFGAYGSNHALATALHAKALGLEPHVVLSPQAPGPFAAATLRAHAALGTVIHPVDGWDGAREAVVAKRALMERDGIEPYVIPMGGTSALGAVGYVNAALELVEQAGASDRVYVAGGTLGTAVGLAVGFAVSGVKTRVVAVRVTPDSVASDTIARDVAESTIALLRSLDPAVPSIGYQDLGLELRHDWFEPGYGVVTPETSAAVRFMADREVKTETTYTGKAVAAMLADAAQGALEGCDVVFVDTYSSSPMPAPGPDTALPQALQHYVAECDRLFGRSAMEGESE